MSDIVKFENVESRILNIRNQQVILDSDVAELYGVQTKEINQAVKNNPDKFPVGYVFGLQSVEKQEVVKNFDHLQKLKFSPVMPVAFTEKGLYMLATILKSERATQTTLTIVETFANIRELSRTISQLSGMTEESPKQKSLMQKSGEILAEILDDGFETTDKETSFEVNFAVMKFKHTVKQKKRKDE